MMVDGWPVLLGYDSGYGPALDGLLRAIGWLGVLAAAVATVRALGEGIVPPTLNLHEPDENAGELDLTPLEARRRDLDVALVNAFGFGGQNAAFLLRRWEA